MENVRVTVNATTLMTLVTVGRKIAEMMGPKGGPLMEAVEDLEKDVVSQLSPSYVKTVNSLLDTQ